MSQLNIEGYIKALWGGHLNFNLTGFAGFIYCGIHFRLFVNCILGCLLTSKDDIQKLHSGVQLSLLSKLTNPKKNRETNIHENLLRPQKDMIKH